MLNIYVKWKKVGCMPPGQFQNWGVLSYEMDLAPVEFYVRMNLNTKTYSTGRTYSSLLTVFRYILYFRTPRRPCLVFFGIATYSLGCGMSHQHINEKHTPANLIKSLERAQ
jgi:hypothetical protein